MNARKKPLVVALALGLSAAHPVQAAERFWDTNHFFGFLCGGSFNNVDCWGAGGNPAPGAADIATWNSFPVTPYTVTFANGVTNQKARIRNDNLIWDLNAKTYTLTADNSVTNPSLAIGINNGETGRLTIKNGTANSARTVLAINGSSNGFLTVTGDTTTFNAGTGFTVAYWEFTQAGISVLGGSRLTSSGSTAIGFHATASGNITVSGLGSRWNTSGTINVGSSAGGRGSLAVRSDGRVTADALNVWNAASSVSTVNPSSPGGGTLNVAGTLALNGGASAISRFGIVDTISATFGTVAGGILSGTATIRGAASVWDTELFTSGSIGAGSTTVGGGGKLKIAGDSVIGQLSGSNGVLVVESQGTVQSGSNVSIGRDSGAQGTASIGGSDASWSVTGALHVGGSATGSGGAGTVAVGSGARLSAGSLTVWNAGSSIRTGDAASFIGGTIDVAGTLTLRDGARASSFNGIVDSVAPGIVVGIYAANAAITGTGTVWETTQFYTGLNGTGTTTVSQHGKVASSGNTVIGLNTSSIGHLLIEADGRVETRGNASLGLSQGATGSVRVDGIGALWGVSGTLAVGGTDTLSQGGAGTLTVANGARVLAGDLTVLNAASSVDTTVSGGGTINVAGSLGLHSGARAISSFGVVDSISANFGTVAGGILASNATIRGAGSVWSTEFFTSGSIGTGATTVGGGGALKVSGDSLIGQLSGSNGVLAVESQGVVQTGGNVSIGRDSGSQGTAMLDGSGATWSVAGGLYVGGNLDRSGGKGILHVGAGARTAARDLTVWNGESSIDTGVSSPLSGGVIDVTGTLTLRDGGKATSYYGFVGDNRPNAANGIGAGKVVVSGNGSLWDTALLTIGEAGPDAARVSGGGTLRSGGDTVIGLGGPAVAMLRVDAGGNVETGGHALIGSSAGSSSDAIVAGADARWRVGQSLQLGHDFSETTGRATLTVEQGGRVDVAGVLSVHGTGQLWIDGGTLTAKAMDVSGLAGLEGGTLTIQDTLTTSAAFTFFLLGGTLSTGSLGPTSLVNFISGELRLTRDDLVVGAGGQLGNNLSLTATRTVAVTNKLTVNSGAELQLDSGTLTAGSYVNDGRLVVRGPATSAAGGQLTNNGSIQLVGGAVELTQKLNNTVSGSVTGQGMFSTQAGLTNAGAINFSGATEVRGRLLNAPGGSIVIAAQTTTFHDDVVHDGAVFDIASGSEAVFLGAYSGAGRFTGAGTLTFAGDVRPGNSPALVDVEGNMTLLGSTNTTMELGGRARGTQYDAFDVGGTLRLAGTLTVSLLDLGGGTFVPQSGDSFDLFAATDLRGQFGALNLAALAPDLTWNISYLNDVTGSTDVVRLSVTAVPEPHTWLLMLAGLGLAGSIARRNRKACG